jgi:hypothetical protein
MPKNVLSTWDSSLPGAGGRSGERPVLSARSPGMGL